MSSSFVKVFQNELLSKYTKEYLMTRCAAVFARIFLLQLQNIIILFKNINWIVYFDIYAWQTKQHKYELGLNKLHHYGIH